MEWALFEVSKTTIGHLKTYIRFISVKYVVCVLVTDSWLRIVLGTRLTDRISNSRLHEKCGSIPLSRAIMKERLRWLGHVLRMKDDRLPKIVLFGQPFGATRKADPPCLDWEDVINKDLKEMGTSWEGVKRRAFYRLGWRRSMRSCVGLRRLGAAASY